MILGLCVSFIGTIMFSILFNNDRKEWLLCGVNGALGYGIYALMEQMTQSVVLASLVATLVVSLVAYIMAYMRVQPVTIYELSGIIPLVPGVLLYQSLSEMMSDQMALAVKSLLTAFEVASAVAVGMLLMASLRKFIPLPERHL